MFICQIFFYLLLLLLSWLLWAGGSRRCVAKRTAHAVWQRVEPDHDDGGRHGRGVVAVPLRIARQARAGRRHGRGVQGTLRTACVLSDVCDRAAVCAVTVFGVHCAHEARERRARLHHWLWPRRQFAQTTGKPCWLLLSTRVLYWRGMTHNIVRLFVGVVGTVVGVCGASSRSQRCVLSVLFVIIVIIISLLSSCRSRRARAALVARSRSVATPGCVRHVGSSGPSSLALSRATICCRLSTSTFHHFDFIYKNIQFLYNNNKNQ